MDQRYESPLVVDYGDLRDITVSFHPLVGAGSADLSFSVVAPTHPGGGGDVDPGSVASGSGGGVAGAAASGGGGKGAGGGGGGGSLPFTGLAVGAVAAIGSGLTAAGTLLRRFTRRRTGGRP
jgi:hypothetical protein